MYSTWLYGFVTVPIVAQTERTRQLLSRRVAVLIERVREESEMEELFLALFILGLLTLAFWMIYREDKRLKIEREELKRFRDDLIECQQHMSSALISIEGYLFTISKRCNND